MTKHIKRSPITLRFADEILDQISARAEKEGKTRTELIHDMCIAQLGEGREIKRISDGLESLREELKSGLESIREEAKITDRQLALFERMLHRKDGTT